MLDYRKEKMIFSCTSKESLEQTKANISMMVKVYQEYSKVIFIKMENRKEKI